MVCERHKVKEVVKEAKVIVLNKKSVRRENYKGRVEDGKADGAVIRGYEVSTDDLHRIP